jgi:chaperonin GroES
MIEKISPLYDRVLVKLLPQEEKTEGGIIIPDVAKEKPQKGQIINVGVGRLSSEGKVVPLQVKVGDVVFFGKFAGTEVSSGYLIIREDEVLGIVEK